MTTLTRTGSDPQPLRPPQPGPCRGALAQIMLEGGASAGLGLEPLLDRLEAVSR